LGGWLCFLFSLCPYVFFSILFRLPTVRFYAFLVRLPRSRVSSAIEELAEVGQIAEECALDFDGF
jgi:hypothetical protein